MYLWGDLINMQTVFLRYLVILLLAINFYVNCSKYVVTYMYLLCRISYRHMWRVGDIVFVNLKMYMEEEGGYYFEF